MQITVVNAAPMGVLVCLPSLGTYWHFAYAAYLPGPPTIANVRAMKPIAGSAAGSTWSAVQFAWLPDECSIECAVPLVGPLDATTGMPAEVLDWSALTFTIAAAPIRRTYIE